MLYFSTALLSVICDSERRKKAHFISVLYGHTHTRTRTRAAFARITSKICFIQNRPMPRTDLGLLLSYFINLFVFIIFFFASFSLCYTVLGKSAQMFAFVCSYVHLSFNRCLLKSTRELRFLRSYLEIISDPFAFHQSLAGSEIICLQKCPAFPSINQIDPD